MASETGPSKVSFSEKHNTAWVAWLKENEENGLLTKRDVEFIERDQYELKFPTALERYPVSRIFLPRLMI